MFKNSTAECETKLKVAWVKLQGMNFQALVTETEAHDIVQKVLDAALSTLSPTASVGGVTVNVGDRLTNLLSSHCFLYFSAGDRFRYEASKAIASAVQLKMGGTASLHGYSGGDVGALTGQGINLMRKASRYWRSADDVVTSSCVLKKCCGELALLGALGRDAIVDICIATAANFEDPRDLRAVGTSALLRGEADDSDKERELYHGIGGAGMGPSERETARKACYSCLIDAIKASGSDVKNVLHMVERCINTSKDGTFLTMLFDR